MSERVADQEALDELSRLASQCGITLRPGDAGREGASGPIKVRRTSSRFCLGVEHGDYNGTELFGVGTDRFIWMAYRAAQGPGYRLFSGNFPGDGVVAFESGQSPAPRTPQIADTWARFAYGVDFVLRREGFRIDRGIEGVIHGNIPGGGMSRSASLTLNLILSVFDVNGISGVDPLRVVDLAQQVENDYIGSPCGQLDQIMILFAREGMGTHYDPGGRQIRYVSLGSAAPDFRIVSLDTGTERPGLEKSTYRVRRAECEELVERARPDFGIQSLADVRDQGLYDRLLQRFGAHYPHLCRRLEYIFGAQRRFAEMLAAWERGDVASVGRVFREDGIGLRDAYEISGPELECMCVIARAVPGVLGERMLGGGDKGASGALVLAESVADLERVVKLAYPRSYPDLADRFAVHSCRMVDGVKEWCW